MNDKRRDGRIIVVGGGLAGLVATAAIVEAGGSVTLLEKSFSILEPGGNAALTISGINGLGSSYQRAQKIDDSLDAFMEDIVKSGEKRTPLVEILCRESGDAIDWLTKKFNLNFVLSRAGGHNHARTHKTRDKNTGYTTVRALASRVQDWADKKPHQLEIFTSCTATRLVVTGNSVIGGVECFYRGAVRLFAGEAVILATGGFGADFGFPSLISTLRPDLANLSTCCVLGTTGDGIKMAEAVDARTTQMMYIQVNPTGLIDPADVSNRVKVSASESIRGDGGIIIDRFGRRFVNEIAKREILSKELVEAGLAGNGPFRIVLNSKTTHQLSKYIQDYFDKGLMQTYADGAEFCAQCGIPIDAFRATLAEYNDSGRNAKENNVPDKFGKLHFRNMPFEFSDQMTVALIEPVIGHCAGGLAIDSAARVLSVKTNKPIGNLFAAGEVAGGVDPSMLVGNALLECVVFGRIAGLEASKQVYGSEYVARHMNPEILVGELRESLERGSDELRLLEEEHVEKIAGNERLKKALDVERAELFQIAKLLHQFMPDIMPAFDIDVMGADVVITPDPKEVLTIVRNKEMELEAEVENKTTQIREAESKLANTLTSIREAESLGKTLVGKKANLEAQLEKLMNKSTVLREIHEHEKQLEELVQRQRLAEEAKAQEQKAFENWTTMKQEELAKLRQKTEEVYVMMEIEKIETKKELDTMRSILKKFNQKLDGELVYATKAAKLSNDPDFPFFHKPFRLPPLLDG